MGYEEEYWHHGLNSLPAAETNSSMQHEHGPGKGKEEMESVAEDGADPEKGKKNFDDGIITKDPLAPTVDTKTREHKSALGKETLSDKSGGMSISGRSSTCGSGDGEAESLTDGDCTFSSDGEDYEDAIDLWFTELVNEDIHDEMTMATAGQGGIDTILTLFDVEGDAIAPVEASPVPV